MSQPWYAEGLRFKCTSCGNCCTGPEGAVWFTPEEGREMAKALGLDEATFIERHSRVVDGHRTLNELETEHGFDCEFLDRESVPGKALCSLYRARPLQCRTWPFWPELLKSRRAWERHKADTPCPGMDTGPMIKVEEIVARLAKHRERESTPW